MFTKIENKLKEQAIISTEKEKYFCSLSGQSSELAVVLVKNTISKRYSTRIVNYERESDSMSNIFADSHRFGTNPGSFKGASKEECLEKFEIIEKVFSSNEYLPFQVQSLQEELEGQKNENLQLSKQLMEYNYEESTPITSPRSQRSYNDGEIERILKEQIIIGA